MCVFVYMKSTVIKSTETESRTAGPAWEDGQCLFVGDSVSLGRMEGSEVWMV